MNSKVSQFTKVFKAISSIPSVSSANIFPGHDGSSLYIHSKWTSQDVVKMEKVDFSRDFFLDEKLNVLSAGIPQPNGSSIMSVYSENGRRAVFTEKKSPDGVFVEIWNKSRKENTFDLTDKEHGKIVSNDCFGYARWSSNEKYLLYTAEVTHPKSVSYFKESSPGKGNEEKIVKGEEFVYREEWGEQVVGSHHPILCVLEIDSGNVEIMPMDSIDDEISVGQAIWGPNDETIIFEGWSELPYRLGIIFCLNRRSALYSINIETKIIERITGNENCVRSPRFSPDFKTLLYFENPGYGPHVMCCKLQKFDWSTKVHSTVVDVVHDAKKNEFPGLYQKSLCKRCWSSDGKYIFLSNVWQSYLNIMCINIDNGSVQKINVDKSFGSCSVIDVYNNTIIASFSSPNTEPGLMIGYISFGDEVTVDWKYITKPIIHSDISWEVATLEPTVVNPSYPNLNYDVIILRPTSTTKEKLPLLLSAHGGPHSAFTGIFSYLFTSFAKLNFVVCLVNYRGSIGFGENSVRSLPGNIGSQDVVDTQNAANYVKLKYNIGDVFYWGGSHGGFLGAHVIGQFPEFYKAVVLLNPVIDLSIKFSDIPDWSLVESGHVDEYDASCVIKPDTRRCMWEVSPIRYAENIKTPVLLLLGKNDLRVSSSQGLMLYKILKARKVPTKLFMYEDNHSLSKTAHYSDLLMQAAMWYETYSTSNVSGDAKE